MNNIFKTNSHISSRFVANNNITLIKTDNVSYILVLKNSNSNYFYKIPLGFNDVKVNKFLGAYVCFDTMYFSTLHNYFNINNSNRVKFLTKLDIYKPVYFNRFKYVGKGFKLIFKKKKKLLNCIFGYSHIYWVKLQSTIIKKTKKYKFFFASKNFYNYNMFIHVLKKIKPINRYTLRGVRTYTHSWVKRKGRKSVATHV